MSPSPNHPVTRMHTAWSFFVPEHPLLMIECINVIDAYATPDRAYHNRSHLADVLAQLDWAQGVMSLSPASLHMTADAHQRMFKHIELALFYHDAVYAAAEPDNEARSRDLFLTHAASFGMDEDDRRAIARLIDLTTDHSRAAAPDEQIMADCDLAILGADSDAFAAYDRAIAQEYAHVPAAFYAAARALVLQRFLDQPRLFKTDAFHHRYDAQARHNLRHALAPSPMARLTRFFKR